MFKRLISLLLAVFLVVGGIPQLAFAAGGVEVWNERSPIPTGRDLNGLAYGNEMFVAVGDKGTIATSEDGASWTKQTSGTTDDLFGVTYANGKFVAVGSAGRIATSSDGITWSSNSIQTSSNYADQINLSAITYAEVSGAGLYVAVGAMGKIVTSPDGLVWTLQTNSSNDLTDIAFGNGKFVTVGRYGVIRTSNDGKNWSSTNEQVSGNSNYQGDLQSIAFGEDTFAAIGYMGARISSANGQNGLTWTNRSNDSLGFTSVTYGAGKFVAVGYNYFTSEAGESSAIGSTWENRGQSADTLNAITFAEGIFVAVGEKGAIETSSDGITWNKPTVVNRTSLYGVAHGNNLSVAVGDSGKIMTSEDGIAWTVRTSNTSQKLNSVISATINDFPYFFATGSTGALLMSQNGTTWIPLNAPISTPKDLVFGNQLVIVGDAGKIFTTPNGISWTMIDLSLLQIPNGSSVILNSVAYHDGTYVAVGNNGVILTSAGGVIWTQRESGVTTNLKGVTYGSGGFVAVGDPDPSNEATNHTVILTSPDGITWTKSELMPYYYLTDVIHNNNEFLAIGQAGTMLTSVNGTTWTPKFVDMYPDFNSAVFANGLYLIVGSNGTILQSGSVNMEQAATPIASPASGAVTSGTGVSLSTATSGASIYYTTDGNTPTSGSTLYAGTPITVTAAVTIKAIAVKAGMSDSAVMSESYTIQTTTDHTDSTPTTPTPPADPGVEVLVNGKAENAGTAKTTTKNDQTVTTVTVDPKKLEEKLATEGDHTVITIPVKTGSDVVAGELNGQMVKNMENKQAVVVIQTDNASYKLPADQINIDAISEQVGTSVQLQDIVIRIEIAEPPADTWKVVENAAEEGGFSLVGAPVNFTVTGTYGDKTIDVSKFNIYVERTVAIPEGVDPNKITTGIIVDPDGTARHVPTKVVQIDGKFYAVISSLTNSTYSVVWHPITFADVANHWAKDAVNDMGSRMVIDGIGNDLFQPDQAITRAEFASIIVKALGLKPEKGASSFKDITGKEWFAEAVVTAEKNGLIGGYPDGTFRPENKITREEAIVILSKAMEVTGLKTKLSPNAVDALHAFSDAPAVSAWSRESVANSLQAGVIEGHATKKLAPQASITRAEVAAIMQRLLLKSGLI